MKDKSKAKETLRFLKQCETEASWDNVIFPSWVPKKIKQRIIEFWGCFGRTPKNYLEDMSQTSWKMGELVEANYCFGFDNKGNRETKPIKGLFIHAWNNMERVVVGEEGKYYVVPDFDITTKPKKPK